MGTSRFSRAVTSLVCNDQFTERQKLDIYSAFVKKETMFMRRYNVFTIKDEVICMLDTTAVLPLSLI